ISLVFGRAPYLSAGSFGGKVEVGNFQGASLAIRRIVEGGTLVGSPSNPFVGFGVIPTALIPSGLRDVGALSGLTGSYWINIGDPTLVDFTIDGAQALLPLPAGAV